MIIPRLRSQSAAAAALLVVTTAGVGLEIARARRDARGVPPAESKVRPSEMRILPLVERDARGEARRIAVRVAFFDAAGASIAAAGDMTLAWELGGQTFRRTVRLTLADFAPLPGDGPGSFLQTSPFSPIELPGPEATPAVLTVSVHSQRLARISHVTP